MFAKLFKPTTLALLLYFALTKASDYLNERTGCLFP
jgi:hypothetical protein